MKTILIAFALLFAPAADAVWLTDFADAQKQAATKQHYILVSFAGTDWCAPCITMRHEIFEKPAFIDYANKHLILVRADFPRLKKNKLSKEQTEKNEALAARYNEEGKFPYTVLLDANGKVIKQWDGLPDEKADAFVQEISKVTNMKP